jgi:hypothetical protein
VAQGDQGLPKSLACDMPRRPPTSQKLAAK